MIVFLLVLDYFLRDKILVLHRGNTLLIYSDPSTGVSVLDEKNKHAAGSRMTCRLILHHRRPVKQRYKWR